jgi:GNAT superfamily N-acetyltransferase
VSHRSAPSRSTAIAELRIRAAAPGDAPLIHGLIRELAEYERLADQVVGTEADIDRHLFGERPAAEAVVAELDGEPAGFALFFTTFSTFLSRPGIWLEDVFVRPEHRRAGIGRALVEHLAAIAIDRGCGRLEWSALDWNEPALAFYRELGARPLQDWIVHRLDGDALRSLGAAAGGQARA